VIDDVGETPIFECFPNEKFLGAHMEPWDNNIVNYLVIGDMPR